MIVSHFLFLFQENLNTALFPSEYTTSLLRGQWKHSVNKLVFGVERLFFKFFDKYSILNAAICCARTWQINRQQESAAQQDMISLLAVHLGPYLICLSVLLLCVKSLRICKTDPAQTFQSSRF